MPFDNDKEEEEGGGQSLTMLAGVKGSQIQPN